MVGLPVGMLAKLLGVETADLSQVDEPKGRLDFLASKTIEHVVSQLGGGGLTPKVADELKATYNAARPVIDGLLVKHLGQVRLNVPQEALQLLQRMKGAA